MNSTTPPALTLRQHLDAASMGALQWRAIALCFLINAIDGIDVLVMAFTASAVTKDWGLNNVVLGWLLSAGIIGMVIPPFLAVLHRRMSE